MLMHLATLERLHENRRRGNRPERAARSSPDACVLRHFWFIHTNAEELKGSIKQQLLKLAFPLCHRLPGPGPGADTQRGGKGLMSASAGLADSSCCRDAVSTPSDGCSGTESRRANEPCHPLRFVSLLLHVTPESLRPE